MPQKNCNFTSCYLGQWQRYGYVISYILVYFIFYYYVSRCSVVDTATRLRVSHPGRDKYFSRLQNVQADYGAHPASYSSATGVLSRGLGVKLSTHFHHMTRLGISGIIPLFPYMISCVGHGKLYLLHRWLSAAHAIYLMTSRK